uniref:DUF2523 domain-containing protein n=1 Tax=Dulem virus 57 TaxID=3145768 RepID=A0AAU8B3Q5_9VIRU
MIITVPVTVATFLKFVFVKALLVFLIYLAMNYGIDYLLGLLEALDFKLSNYSGDMGAGIAFGLNYLKVKEGIKLILTAYTVRFLIRRIPFIGS